MENIYDVIIGKYYNCFHVINKKNKFANKLYWFGVIYELRKSTEFDLCDIIHYFQLFIPNTHNIAIKTILIVYINI